MAPSSAPDPGDPEPLVSAGTDVASPSVPDPVHYPAKDLDVYPQPLQRISPAYPRSALDAQISGAVTLLVLIDEAGRVAGTSVLDAVPDGVFEQAALDALANTAFFPAQKDGRTVRSRVLIKVEFDPAAAGATQ